MSIGEPGQWTTTRFPHFDVEYQVRDACASAFKDFTCSADLVCG